MTFQFGDTNVKKLIPFIFVLVGCQNEITVDVDLERIRKIADHAIVNGGLYEPSDRPCKKRVTVPDGTEPDSITLYEYDSYGNEVFVCSDAQGCVSFEYDRNGVLLEDAYYANGKLTYIKNQEIFDENMNRIGERTEEGTPCWYTVHDDRGIEFKTANWSENCTYDSFEHYTRWSFEGEPMLHELMGPQDNLIGEQVYSAFGNNRNIFNYDDRFRLIEERIHMAFQLEAVISIEWDDSTIPIKAKRILDTRDEHGGEEADGIPDSFMNYWLDEKYRIIRNDWFKKGGESILSTVEFFYECDPSEWDHFEDQDQREH
jgi:hypothetical protein